MLRYAYSLKITLSLALLSCISLHAVAGEFRVLVDDAHPPFSYIDSERKVQGVAVQMVALLLAELAKLEPATSVSDSPVKPSPRAVAMPSTIVAVPWQRTMLTEVKTPNTLFASVVRLPEREQQFIWIHVLFRQSVSLYALRERHLVVRSAADLVPYRIGAPRNSAAHRQLLALGIKPEQIDTGGDPVQNLRKLLAGRLDLVTMQPAGLTWFLKNEGLAGTPLQPVFLVLPDADFYLAATPGTDPALIDQLRKHAQNLEKSRAFTKLRQAAGLAPL